MSEVNPKVLDRISKLMTVQTDRGSTEAEAALAAEHVQRLLQEHNLTLSQVEASGGEASEDAKREKVNTARRAMYKYQRDLMAAVADSNFCLHRIIEVKTPRRGNSRPGPDRMSQRHWLVGRAVNTAASIMMYDYLIAAVKRAAREAGFTEGKDGRYFMEGAVDRLTYRLQQRRCEREAESAAKAAAPTAGNGTHRELVLAEVYGSEADQNNDVLNNYPLGTTATKRRESVEREAARQAKQAALVAEGVNETEAFYRSYGYSEAAAAEIANRKPSRRRGGRGRSQGWTNNDRERSAKLNSAAWGAGREAGANIGLDAQVSANSRKRLPKA